jgi:Tfp pilus assembly protein PilX
MPKTFLRCNSVRHGRGSRRGTIYVFVLATGMVVALIAAAVLTVAQVNGRVVSQSNDSAEAEVLAENAVEYALNVIANDSNWRTDYPTSMAVGPISMGRGTISFTLQDDVGGTLATSTTDSVRIYGTGKVRNATKVYSLKAAPTSPLTCLQTAMDVSGVATFGSITTISGSGIIASNSTINGGSNSFNSPLSLEARTAITSYSGSAAHTSPATARTFPDSTHVFDFYKNSSTAVTITPSGPPYQLTNRLLGPGVNCTGGATITIGPTSTNGIYVINCGGNTITIANCRVIGTLVLLNVGGGSIIQNSNYFQQGWDQTGHSTGYPVLMVQMASSAAALTIKTAATNLADNSTNNINYNQTLAPYQGVADATFTTQYPSRFDGLVYVWGALTTNVSPNVNGVLIVDGTYTGTSLSSLTLTYDSSFYKNPPPGFTGTALAPVSGSWRWETAP